MGMLEFRTEIRGAPCTIRVDHYETFRGSFHEPPWTDLEFTVMNRSGKLMSKFQESLTWLEKSDIQGQVEKEMQDHIENLKLDAAGL